MVKIISDSTCDLSPELLARYEIDILPLHILLGDQEFEDGKNITPDQIYAWSDANKTTPKTSAPAMADAIELFRPYVTAGREIVCLFYFIKYVHFWKCDAPCCRRTGSFRADHGD